MRVAVYARVSTDEQSPDMQLRELREYCERRKWKHILEYKDVGVSGSRDSRPELDELLQACRRRQVDAVVVYRFDRFARSLSFLVKSLDEFRALGIEFISLHEQIDTTTPGGRLAFGIFAAVAEFERELIRSRVKSGLASAKARGVQVGRPKRVVDVDKIAQARRENNSWGEIEKRLGISRRTAKRRLLGTGKTPAPPIALSN